MVSGILVDWIFGLGDAYGVNPIVFGAIYVGATPLFALSLAWLVRNIRQGASLLLPVLATGLCGVSTYLYVLLVGENLPVWVYGGIGLLIAYGAYVVKQRIDDATAECVATSGAR